MVVVYGSAGILPDSADWQVARSVGRYLAEAGYVLLSGGYSGVMAAASQGLPAVGNVVVVSSGFSRSRSRPQPGWTGIRFDTMRERLPSGARRMPVSRCAAASALERDRAAVEPAANR
jgi:predicted Rossmann-fold nucleotide-binding protein